MRKIFEFLRNLPHRQSHRFPFASLIEYKRSLLTSLMLAPLTLLALPLGNPCDASLYKEGIFFHPSCTAPFAHWYDSSTIRIGFYGDFVFNRHMEIDTNESNATLRKTEIFTQAGYLAINIWQKFDLFGTLGVSSINFTSPDRSFLNPDENDEMELVTESDFSWSIGTRATLWQWGCLGFGGEIQYFRFHPHINYVHSVSSEPLYLENSTLSYQEWQIGFGAAYRINILGEKTALVPYGGIRYGRALINTHRLVVGSPANATFFNQKSQRAWGFALGTTLLGCNKISVTAEGRFASENAFFVLAQLRF
jgi:major outer membrane protein